MYTRERRQLKLFVRRDIYGRFLSCLVYLPRDRYNTTVRERIAAILKEQLDGDSIEYTAHVGESFAARLHFVVRPGAGRADRRARRRRPRAPLRRGRPVLARRLHHRGHRGVRRGAGQPLVRTYAGCFPEAYKEDYPPQTGAVDLGRLEEIEGDEGMALSLYEDVAAPPGEARLKVYRIGPPLSLSEVLPILSTTGVEVVDERPYQLEGLERESYIYDFGLRYHRRDARPRARAVPGHRRRGLERPQRERRLQRARPRAPGSTWRQATVLRAYAKYMRQGGTPFAQDYIEDALRNNVDITRYLVQLFEARFDPGRSGRDGAIAGRQRGSAGQVRRPRGAHHARARRGRPASTTTGSCAPT